jgi:hypothetical protein
LGLQEYRKLGLPGRSADVIQAISRSEKQLAAFCQDCRAWSASGRWSSMYSRASLSVRSAGPSLTWIERGAERTIRAGHKPNLTRRRLPAHFALRDNFIAAAPGAPLACAHRVIATGYSD